MTPSPSARSATLALPDPGATAAFARALAPRLAAGDVLLLSGGLGAGKTHFARALIQARLPVPEDVPSPTFTLVQVYETPEAELWHADLYRLSGPDEVIELGLDAAFETAICLVEWPDRLGTFAPAGALELSLAPGASEDARSLTAEWTAPRWDGVLSGLLT
ncbi:tRNA (adenosine(37)-N6)-threonylcarbamoyltransferase complex ATPase subunit type 1 TsaE [Roseivivax sediminis]|uniref:tRNA threonylcarbamoyladenosine biosynthesis protein TsaE n=1 Tax=Roseivivax sediminis TaxID=936889 RepID=A0A1I1UBK2_9RHOB|nr:tRNA (adenosine(37)-N6)-threonylcarbamoyltransferase complex ATPase subunit type 1 TsaE [Roseivivax sediminis]SFD68117.1 tRNA threonylcarbamoyladenosine biosynthesis protein TsaE [Roseivivax sediminis]